MSAGDLILSFLFTWSIGLAAPAIMRFAIYRRALLSSEAMAWAGSLGIGELILFSLLGSQSKSHAVLLLIGIVAYRILGPVGTGGTGVRLAIFAFIVVVTAHAPPSTGPRFGPALSCHGPRQ